MPLEIFSKFSKSIPHPENIMATPICDNTPNLIFNNKFSPYFQADFPIDIFPKISLISPYYSATLCESRPFAIPSRDVAQLSPRGGGLMAVILRKGGESSYNGRAYKRGARVVFNFARNSMKNYNLIKNLSMFENSIEIF